MDRRELERMLQVLSNNIGLDYPPGVDFSAELPRNVLGSYDHQRQLILIHPSVKPVQIPTLLVHELCHAVLYRVGYAGVGHGVAFLATYRLLLQKARLQETDSIESCAVANWNPWTPWPIWYRHVSEASEIARSITSDVIGYETSSAEAMALRVIRKMSRSGLALPRWMTLRWTEIIADTRGHWFALMNFQSLMLVVFVVAALWYLLPKMPSHAIWALAGVTILWMLLRTKRGRMILAPWAMLRNSLASRGQHVRRKE